jgi:large subunit ribosomal protein L10
VNKLRRTCFEKGVEMKVAKNTLIRKALEAINSEKYAGVYESLAGVTALMFTNNPKDPAVILSDFRTGTKGEIPGLKAAFIGTDVFVGDNQLAVLKNIKTKNELIGEVIGLLMSPISRVLSALQQKAEKESTAGAEATASEPAASESTASESKASESAPAE